ncbi:MAG: hypothetical protein K5796_02970 [Lachnospiraceae bacterium]|nr:hypothetical protein [Lachnospiraceae bacterium]
METLRKFFPKGAGLLVFGTWLVTCVPEVLSVKSLYSTGADLTTSVAIKNGILFLIVEVLLISLAIGIAGKADKDLMAWFKSVGFVVLYGGSCLFFVGMLEKLLTDAMVSSKGAYITIALIMHLLRAVIVTFMMILSRTGAFFVSLKGTLRKPAVAAVWFIFGLLAEFVPVSVMGNLIAKGHADLTTHYAASVFAVSMVKALFVLIGFCVANGVYELTGEISEAEPETQGFTKWIPLTVAGAAVIFSIIFWIIVAGSVKKGDGQPVSVADSQETDAVSMKEYVLKTVNVYLEESDKCFDNKQYFEAYDYYTLAVARMYAWLGYIDKDSDKLVIASELDPDDELIGFLTILSSKDPKGTLKYIVNNSENPGIYLAQLKVLMDADKDPELSLFDYYEFQVGEYPIGSYYLPTDLTETEKKEIKEEFNSFFDNSYRLELMESYYREYVGDAEGAAKKAVEVARKYPEDMYILKTAVQFMTDSKYVLENDIMEAYINKVTELLIENKSSDDVILKEKVMLIDIYLKHDNRWQAKNLFETFFPEITSREMKLTELYLKLEFDGLSSVIDDIELLLSEDPEDASLLTMVAVYTLPKDLDKAVSYGKRIADIVRNTEGKKRAEADSALGIFMEYMLGYYSPQFWGTPWQVYYNSLSDAKKEEIKNDDLMNAYVVVRRGAAEEKEPVITAVIDKYGDLPYAYYKRGLNYYNNKDYEQAKADLVKSTSLDTENPNAWLQLGFAYDNLYDFANSLASYERAKELCNKYRFNPTYAYLGLGAYIDNYIGNAKHYLKEYTIEGEVPQQ